MAGCRRREGASQEALYRRFGPVTFGICRRYAADRMEAEDLHQQAWMRVFDKIEQYQESGSLEGWLKRVAVRVCLNAYQKRRRRLQWLDHMADDQLPETAQSLSAPDFMAQELLAEAIAALPAGAQLVFNLYAIESYTHAEIAQELGITEANSRQQLLRARTALARRIKPAAPDSAAVQIMAHVLAFTLAALYQTASLIHDTL